MKTHLRKVKSLLKKETGTWILVGVTFIIGGISIFTANYLAHKKSTAPDKPTSAASNCTLTYAIPTPVPCENKIDIVGMTIDRSKSMTTVESDGRPKLAWAKDAAKTFVNTIINSGTKNIDMSVNSFGMQGNDGTGRLGTTYNSILHTPLTSNYTDVLNAINGVNFVSGVNYTCLECGIRISNSQIQSSSVDKKVAIILSDGMGNRIWNGSAPGDSASRQAAIAAADAGKAQGVEYHVVGYGLQGNIDETTLRTIAGTTGSYQYKPNSGDWSNALLQILNRICSPGGGGGGGTPTPTPTYLNLQINPTADTYVSSSSPTRNYGNNAKLITDNSPALISYIKFDLSSLSGKTINYASLALFVTDKSSGKQAVMQVDGDWSESGMNYNNRPATGQILNSFVASSNSQWMLVDLSSFVKSNVGKTVSIAIVSDSTDSATFNSKNSSSNKPLLVVQ